jgi:bifunctional ADP-heptose synthase (sugar kinase/adenylyltransferase)
MIESIAPDILVKGGEYALETIVGYDYVMSKGGEVLTVPMKAGVSSTFIIETLALKKFE